VWYAPLSRLLQAQQPSIYEHQISIFYRTLAEVTFLMA